MRPTIFNESKDMNFFKLLVRELVPAPTINRFKWIYRHLNSPKRVIILIFEPSARLLLPAKWYLKLRNVMKTITQKKATNVEIRRETHSIKAKSSDAAKPISNILFNAKEFTSVSHLLEEYEGKINCSIVVCCAFLGRHDLLRLVIEETQHTSLGTDVYVCLVGSNSADFEFLKAMTSKYPNVVAYIVKNNPVGAKWQSTVNTAVEIFNYELLGITGSDDILSKNLLDNISSRHSENLRNNCDGSLTPGLYATMEWLIYAVGEKQEYLPQIIKCNYKLESAIEPIGGGRFYSRQFLDSINNQIFDCSIDRLLDDKGFEEISLTGSGVEYYDLQTGFVLNVKGDTQQMNPMAAIVNSSTVESSEFSFRGYNLITSYLSDDVQRKIFPASEKI